MMPDTLRINNEITLTDSEVKQAIKNFVNERYGVKIDAILKMVTANGSHVYDDTPFNSMVITWTDEKKKKFFRGDA